MKRSSLAFNRFQELEEVLIAFHYCKKSGYHLLQYKVKPSQMYIRFCYFSHYLTCCEQFLGIYLKLCALHILYKRCNPQTGLETGPRLFCSLDLFVFWKLKTSLASSIRNAKKREISGAFKKNLLLFYK